MKQDTKKNKLVTIIQGLTPIVGELTDWKGLNTGNRDSSLGAKILHPVRFNTKLEALLAYACMRYATLSGLALAGYYWI